MLPAFLALIHSEKEISQLNIPFQSKCPVDITWLLPEPQSFRNNKLIFDQCQIVIHNIIKLPQPTNFQKNLQQQQQQQHVSNDLKARNATLNLWRLWLESAENILFSNNHLIQIIPLINTKEDEKLFLEIKAFSSTISYFLECMFSMSFPRKEKIIEIYLSTCQIDLTNYIVVVEQRDKKEKSNEDQEKLLLTTNKPSLTHKRSTTAFGFSWS